MNIYEAVKEALKTDKCIITPDFEGVIKIKPTNESGNCIVLKADGSNPSKHGWNPQADELIREDWIVVD